MTGLIKVSKPFTHFRLAHLGHVKRLPGIV